jgi:predicted DNA-binding transcriptional regulator YafY
MEKYKNDAQQRILNALLYLAQQDTPVRLNAIAAHLEVTPTKALRDMENLLYAGLATRTDNNYWQPGKQWMAVKKLHFRQAGETLLRSF